MKADLLSVGPNRREGGPQREHKNGWVSAHAPPGACFAPKPPQRHSFGLRIAQGRGRSAVKYCFTVEARRDKKLDVKDRFVGSSIDTTDSKRVEEALRESERRYRALFETMDEGFCIIEFLDGPHGP